MQILNESVYSQRAIGAKVTYLYELLFPRSIPSDVELHLNYDHCHMVFIFEAGVAPVNSGGQR